MEVYEEPKGKIRISFDTSGFYQFECDKFKAANRNRGADKVTLINKYSKAWDQSKFLNKVHKPGVQALESREGRKLDISGHMAKTRPFST